VSSVSRGLVWIIGLLAAVACSRADPNDQLKTIEIDFVGAIDGRELPEITSSRRRGCVCKVHGRLDSIVVHVFADAPIKSNPDDPNGSVAGFLDSQVEATANKEFIWLSQKTGCVMLSDTNAVCATSNWVEACSLVSSNFAQYSTK